MKTSIFQISVLAALLLVGTGSADETTVDPAKAEADPTLDILWYEIELLSIEGRGWTETKAKYDRLPEKAEGVVRAPVWSLSRHSAGIAVRFKTDATTIRAKWNVTSSSLAMPHMPATGVSGLDLYVKVDGRWRWLAVGQPRQFPENVATLANGIPAGTREYLLYLPLYNGVSSVEIGIAKQSRLQRVERADVKPIVFYGTSITQGGCASRPGMVHTAILRRRLNRPVINLGFSGNGTMDQSMADLLAELDVAVYVIDCLPNMQAKAVKDRVEPLVRTLRKARPDTPILLVEDRSYTDSFLVPGKRQRNETSRAELLAAFKRMQSDGVNGLFYLEGEDQLGDDGEATVDSSHPTDLGFVRMADVFEPALRKALSNER